MTVDIKICGLTTRETVDGSVAAGASHIGFVFFAASPRDIAPDRAFALGRDIGHVARVGVFVAPDDALLDRAAPALDIIQLHGVDPARVANVRARYGLPVWRAAGVASRDDVVAAVAAVAAGGGDRLLFDAKAPTGSALPGGNGVRFDWRLLDGIDIGRAWGLSGGLDAATVGDAVRYARPPLVDVSSGVEDASGVKSVSKIKAFIAAVRAA